MAITQCTITATLKDLQEAVPSGITDATLHIKNDRSFAHGTTIIGPFELSASFNDSGVATLTCIETETPGEKLTIYITVKEGTGTRVINFEPAIIPNSASSALTSISTPVDEDLT